jgi:deoxyribodipyrimidine photo-lyase
MNKILDFALDVKILESMSKSLEFQDYGIHWFRRDLRVAGNQALFKNWKQNQGRVVGVFCFDKKFLSRPDFSVNRFQFFIQTLEHLQNELRELGSDLLFMDVGPQKSFPELIKKIKNKTGRAPQSVSWSRDYEPYARDRDQEMQDLFQSQGVKTFTERDHLLIEPHELTKKGTDDGFYQVYSPFARRWLDIFKEAEFIKRVQDQIPGLQYLSQRETKVEKIFKLNWSELLQPGHEFENKLQAYKTENGKSVTVELPPSGSLEAFKALGEFKNRLDQYGKNRDFPSVSGTSRFSLFLKNGSLTVPQIIAYYGLKPYTKKATARDTFFSELIWREFYYHILFHNPQVEKESFLPIYKNLKWENNRDYFEAWKEGRTGFPIVDAGMRQLNTTGWMHNRVRMIVASFLTKDLLIDWRWGEQYFMETLLDGDIAPNNGGWQWAASTGCDPQPYFRIFNPWSQSKKFDPNGDYIKTFIPELESVPAKLLHDPIMGHATYPEPIVEHSDQRKKALEMYKACRD